MAESLEKFKNINITDVDHKNLSKRNINNDKKSTEYVKNWITNSAFDETSSETSETISSSNTNCLYSDSGSSNLINSSNLNESKKDLTPSTSTINSSNNLDFLQNIRNNEISDNSSPIVIQNSQNVHVGNITVLKGPIYYKQFNSPATGSKNEVVVNNQSERESSSSDNFIEKELRRHLNRINIVQRKQWLAQAPKVPYDEINKAVDYVIISHTASESALTQSENVFIVKNIQLFHVEKPLEWNDIGYNFLIGCDGQAYQGRGWNVVGAHAIGYNFNSVGISFIGCFMKDLPPIESLRACKELIKMGIELGHIKKDYKLLGHCQCGQTESPGRRLFEEIKTWPNFHEF